VEIKKFAGAVAGVGVVFSLGMAPASAADSQVFGLQQTVTDPSGGEIGYTVTKFLPSADPVPYPVSGQLYEVTVRADALNGMPTPAVPAFSAQSDDGQSYPALAGAWTPQGLNAAPLLPGGHSTGKVYFDAVGEAPTSVVYSGGGEALTWIEPPTEAAEEEPAAEEGSSSEEAPAEAAPAEKAPAEESAPAASDGADAAATEGNADVAVQDEEG
jgi:hypothetical protein